MKVLVISDRLEMNVAKIKVLVVENERIIASDIESVLIGFGYEVSAIVISGEEALKSVYQNKPDIVLMDIVLNGEIDGIDVAEIIYKQLNIPVVFVTAYSDSDTVNKAQLADSFGFIIKPYEDRDLHIALELGLYKHQQIKSIIEEINLAKLLFEGLPNAIVATDAENLIRLFNPQAEKILGLKMADLINQNIGKVINFTPGDCKKNERGVSHYQQVSLVVRQTDFFSLEEISLFNDRQNINGQMYIIRRFV
jgi:CheY-like chemotaxis protein